MVERDSNLPSSEDLVRAARENLTKPPSDTAPPSSDVDVEPSVSRPARGDTVETDRRGDPVATRPPHPHDPKTGDPTPVEYRDADPHEQWLPEPPPPKEKRRWGLAWIAAGEVIADSVDQITDWVPDWIGDIFD